MAKSFGNWSLGYSWVNVSIGTATTTGLALYARFRANDPHKRIVASIKDAMTFLQKHKVPPKAAGKLMAEAMSNGKFS